MLFSFRAPLLPNPRMKNLFERDLFSGVMKDDGAQSLPIQRAPGKIGFRTKLAQQLFLNLRIEIDQVARRFIGVKKFRVRTKFAQAFAKSCLAAGNSASDPNGGHLFSPVSFR